MEREQQMFVAKEITKQLGRNFVMMTGAKDLYALSEERGGLMFRLPGNLTKSRINKCKVVLTASDTYHVTFYRVRKLEAKVVLEVKEVYCDTLQSTFEEATGLLTSFR